MIKLTIADSLDKVCDFIDNRLILLMSENKLRQFKPFNRLQVLIKENYRIKNLDNTVLYTEKDTSTASLVITTSEKKGRKSKGDDFGVTFRNNKNNELEMYVDTLKEAFNKGILSSKIKRKVFNMKSVAAICIFLFFIVIIFATGGLAFFLIMILFIILYPIQYLLNKRRFKQTHDKMDKLVNLFEAEFNVKSKLDTNDWITFWGKVKSDIKAEIMDSLPLKY